MTHQKVVVIGTSGSGKSTRGQLRRFRFGFQATGGFRVFRVVGFSGETGEDADIEIARMREELSLVAMVIVSSRGA